MTTTLKMGAGGMADTHMPDTTTKVNDPRKLIYAAPSFEEYTKSRNDDGGDDNNKGGGSG